MCVCVCVCVCVYKCNTVITIVLMPMITESITFSRLNLTCASTKESVYFKKITCSNYSPIKNKFKMIKKYDQSKYA